jgi:two-component system CheB/CheR fusion protein
LFEAAGRAVEDFATCEAFLEAYRSDREGCLLVDAYLPGMTGLELLRHLQDRGYQLPAIMITGNSDVPMAVQAMKAGASDFIEKPIGHDELLAGVERALEQSRDGYAVNMAKGRLRAGSQAHAAAAPDHGNGFGRRSQ